MKIGLFIKREVVEKSFESILIKKIEESGHEIDNECPDYVFSIGGDGTFLKTVQKYIDKLDKIKIVCINKGKLGFFSDFVYEEIDDILSNLNNDKFVSKSYRLVKAKMNNEEVYAVNEIRIENPFHTLTSEVFINDEYLQTFRGNGLVVSTSKGSTAYNKSLGGAVIDSNLELLQIQEIAPINNRLYTSLNSPLVLTRDSIIKFKGDFSNVVIGYDHLVKKDYNSNEIILTLSDKRVTLVEKKDHNNIRRIREAFIDR